MEFNLLALLFTVGTCLISIIIAGKSWNDEAKIWFKNLNHPDKALMVKFMDKFGIIMYLLFGVVLYFLVIQKELVPIIIMIIIILIMGLSPFFLYKTKNLKLFFTSNFKEQYGVYFICIIIHSGNLFDINNNCRKILE